MKKKFLVCAYFARNIGDDLFLKVLFERYPNVDWDLLTANREYNKIFKNYTNVKIIYTYRQVDIFKKSFNLFYMVNEKLLNFRKYDGLIYIGGSIFMQSPAWKLKLKEREYLINKFKNINKKVFILGSNFGPFKDLRFYEKYRELLAMCDDICFREKHSYTMFSNLVNVRVAPDIVFSLVHKSIKEKGKSIGFSIINLKRREGLKEYFQDYNEKITSLIERYINLGYKVKLFSFCENEGDLEAISIIKNQIYKASSDNVEIVNYEGNINLFLDEFKACEIIIGTRFHSLILGLLFNQKIFPIIYSEKTLNVLKDLNVDENYCYIKDIKDLDVDNIVVKIFKDEIENKEVIKRSKRQFENLDLVLR